MSKLSPSQVAEILLRTDISNDTKFVDQVFERLQVGNAVENVDTFFTKLTEKEKVSYTFRWHKNPGFKSYVNGIEKLLKS